ncbi:MAG TPA: hypothetical protein PLT68_11160 [Actinomycetota bacterium]|nr:hypothetical protein [Actinomycetota bacterium]
MTEERPDPTVVGTGERGSRAALAGAVFAVLFVAGWFLLQRSPPIDAPAQELIRYYTDPDQRWASVVAGLYIIPFGGIAFIWFMAALRDRYLRSGAPENVVLSTAQLASGTLYVMAIFAVAAIELSLVWMADQPPDPDFDVDAARTMVAFGAAMREIVALRTGAVFIAVSTSRAMRSGLFPRWYGVLSTIAAFVLMFTYTAFPLTALLMPIWVVATSALVMVQRVTRANPMGN